MKLSDEYRRERKAWYDRLRKEPPDGEQLKSLLTAEAERMGLTLEQLFNPYTFGDVLQNHRSAVLEAAARYYEEKAKKKI